MEKISTPRAPLVPRVANLATLAVMVVATWWSGAQRPVAQPVVGLSAPLSAAANAPLMTVKNASASQVKEPSAAPATGTVAGSVGASPAWQAGTSIPRDALQPVGFLPHATGR